MKEHTGHKDQLKASLHRKRDARKLFDKGGVKHAYATGKGEHKAKGDKEHTRGAVYLAGYAIECKLKAIAMEKHECWTLEALAKKLAVPDKDVFNHGLEVWLHRLGLLKKLLAGYASVSFSSYVNQWRPSWRYSPANPSPEWAEEFLGAIDEVYRWLDANRC